MGWINLGHQIVLSFDGINLIILFNNPDLKLLYKDTSIWYESIDKQIIGCYIRIQTYDIRV